MKRCYRIRFVLATISFGVISTLLGTALTLGADWRQFRGPGGLGVSDEHDLPVRWSSSENVAWRTSLPGPGTSSPVTVGNRVFLTSYSGYALDAADPGDMNNL